MTALIDATKQSTAASAPEEAESIPPTKMNTNLLITLLTEKATEIITQNLKKKPYSSSSSFADRTILKKLQEKKGSNNGNVLDIDDIEVSKKQGELTENLGKKKKKKKQQTMN